MVASNLSFKICLLSDVFYEPVSFAIRKIWRRCMQLMELQKVNTKTMNLKREKSGYERTTDG